jgi:hypothetical protein
VIVPAQASGAPAGTDLVDGIVPITIELAVLLDDAQGVAASTPANTPTAPSPLHGPFSVGNVLATALLLIPSVPGGVSSALIPLALAASLLIGERRRLSELLVRIPSSIRQEVPVPPA